MTAMIDAYRRVDAQSRSPLELVVMLYDGALASLIEARAAAARGDTPARSRSVSKALAIVCSLQEHLNFDDGGHVATELDRLYTYAQGRLVDVSAKQDVSALNEVHHLLACLRDGWQQIAAQSAAS